MDTETFKKLAALEQDLEAGRREMSRVVADRDQLQARLNEVVPSGEGESLEETRRLWKAAKEELVAAKALVRRLEWTSGAPQNGCLVCLEDRAEGHAAGCELAAFLADADVDMGSMEAGGGWDE